MSRYDEDQKKFQTWAVYFLMLCIGTVVGPIFFDNHKEEVSEIYSSLPLTCQKKIDEALDNINERNEALSERIQYYR